MHGLERIDTTALAALLREAAADITASDERAAIAEARCDDLEEELEELRRLLAVTKSRAKAAEQRAHLAEAGIDPVRKQLMLALAKAEQAERRALEAEKSAKRASPGPKPLRLRPLPMSSRSGVSKTGWSAYEPRSNLRRKSRTFTTSWATWLTGCTIRSLASFDARLSAVGQRLPDIVLSYLRC